MIIAVDFDGTLVNGETPINGAREAINILREEGHTIVIHSCNKPKWIERVLRNADIRYDYIHEGTSKPPVDCYLDNRSLTFENWSKALNDIRKLEAQSGRFKD